MMLHAAAGVLAALLLGLVLQTVRLSWAHDEIEDIRAEQVAAALSAAEVARLQSTALLRATEGNANELQTKLRAATASAAAARSDLDRLRSAAAGVGAAPPDDPGAAGCPDDGRLSRLAGLLSEGAGLAEEGGRRVEQLAIEKAGLQRDAAQLRQLLVGPPQP